MIRTKGKGDFKGLRKELEEQYKGVSIIPAKSADELFTVLKGKTKG